MEKRIKKFLNNIKFIYQWRKWEKEKRKEGFPKEWFTNE
tara:strand:- start:305 stop:421 length:117 start_codon:yes stop_codon:yes gene_type:complete